MEELPEEGRVSEEEKKDYEDNERQKEKVEGEEGPMKEAEIGERVLEGVEVENESKKTDEVEESLKKGLKVEEKAEEERKGEGEPPINSEKKEHRHTSWIWNYYKPLNASSSLCIQCNRPVCHQGNTSNLHKHTRRCLPELYKKSHRKVHSKMGAEKEAKVKTLVKKKNSKAEGNFSKIWLHFKNVNGSCSRCRICSKLIRNYGATSGLQRHLRTHPKVHQHSELVIAICKNAV